MNRKLEQFNITDRRHGAAFAVRIVTRAPRDEVVGIQEGGSVKIRLTASPAEGQANIALIKFLSARLGVPESAIEIVAGQDRRDKMVSVEGVTAEEVEARLKPDEGAVDDDSE
jgi:uncharacterized protein (TIGR00251 family)